MFSLAYAILCICSIYLALEKDKQNGKWILQNMVYLEGGMKVKKLKKYEVAFRTSSCGIAYVNIRAENKEDAIERLKKKHYRTDIIVRIREGGENWKCSLQK